MEKMVVFGPIIVFFLIFLSLIIGFLMLVVKLVLKGKASSWQGTLVDKMHKTGSDMDSDETKHYFTLVFETADSKKIKVGTSKKVYDEYKIGDKAIKKSGELWPHKIS